MKKKLLLLFLFVGQFYIAQITISLEQAATYLSTDEGIPDDVAYVKDTKNQLNQFVGIWKGNYGDKSFEFIFEKKIKFGEYSVKWDEIIGKVMVKNSQGKILFSSIGKNYDEVGVLRGINFQKSSYMLNFTYNSYCNDHGIVFIEISKSNANVMYLSFSKDGGIYYADKCPNYVTYVTLLSKEKMVLLKG